MKTATVTRTQVEGLREFVEELSQRVNYLRCEIDAEDFPVWCAALGVDHFYTWVSKEGHRWTYVNIISVNTCMLTVEVHGGIHEDTGVTYPKAGAAGKRWQFTYEIEES